MPAPTFTVSIRVGNDAMRTAGDVASALRRIADFLDDNPAQDTDGMVAASAIRDDNGNLVGRWEVG